MVKDTPRRLASATLLVIALSAGLALASGRVSAAEATNPTARQADIDAFLNELQRTSDAAAAKPQAQPAPAPAVEAAAAPEKAATPPPAADAAVRTPVAATPPLEEENPFRMLLLMFGGILICALATVGLTLAVFALRKDQRKKRRARQRRFIPYPPRNETPVAHN